ncbi:PPR domain-containing protein, partial [Cephalotus follicularis]
NFIAFGYIRTGDTIESLWIFRRMVLGEAEPNQVMFVSVLVAWDHITILQFALSVHSPLIKRNTMVATALISMYSKCGSLACSHNVFDDMPHKILVS